MRFIAIILFFTMLAYAEELKKVKLELLWVHQFEFAGFYMAKEKGYYKDIGLDVEIIDGFKKDVTKDVLDKKVDFGVASSKIIYDAIKGKEVVALASIFQSSPYAWVVKKDSNITKLSDFVGKNVMHAQHSLDNIELLAMLKAKGVDTSKINFIPTSYNIHDLIDNKCDIMSAYVSNEPHELEKDGIKYTLFKPVLYGIDFYGDVLFTSKIFLNNNQELVKDFREASLKGWKYAFENIEETIHLIHNKYNPSKTLGHLRYEANILKDQSLYPFVSVGTMDAGRWMNIANTFEELGYIKKAYLPDEFIYKPEHDDYHYEIIVMIVVVAVLFIAFLAYAFRRYSIYLKKLISDRTKRLDNEKQNYKRLYTGSIDGIFILKDKKFIKVNDAGLRMLGYESAEELLNIHPSQISPEFQPDGISSKDKAEAMMDQCIKNGSNRFEWVHRKKDGSDFWCEVALTKLKFDNKDVIQAAIRDISRQKLLEENLEKEVRQRTKELEFAMRAKSDFLANMSHEIRTPLNAIIGFVDILFRQEQEPQKQKKLKIVKESGNSLLTIINDILDFSKIENNMLGIEKIPLYTNEPFIRIVDLFYEKAKEKDISIELTIDDKLPKRILGDIVRIKQVFSNLLSNAIKFAKDESVVKVNVNFLKAKNLLFCEVIDDGIGIPKEKLEHIFDAFIQEDSSTTRKYGGTGLGLSISKSLITLMDGEIGVDSKPKEGSRFYFSIPIVEAQNIQEIQKDSETESETMNGRVLVVEDNKSNQLLMKMLLNELGLEYELADDGLEAIKALKNSVYDLVLMDENMPNMNGIEATKVIRDMDELKDVIIIAVTANALKGDKDRFIKAGMNDYISKPIDYKKLRSTLKKYLK